MANTRCALTPGTLEKARQEQFANWLHKMVLTDRASDSNIRKIGLKPEKRVMCYKGCEVNGYRFYTKTHEEHRSRDNSGVCVRGEIINETQHDYYGVLEEVIELTYDGVESKVLLFMCHWFDIINGVKVDHEHGLIEVKHTSTLRTNEPFILACQATLVYYLPYASDKRERQQWSIAMKTTKKEKLGVEDIDANHEFFQEEQPNCPVSISIEQKFIWDNILIQPHEYEPVHPNELSYHTPEDVRELEEEEEIEEQEIEEEEAFEEIEEDNFEEDW
jgi:Domain of unknown function (DUF4216)